MNATEERRPARGCEAGLWPPAIQQAGRAIESVTNQGGGGGGSLPDGSHRNVVVILPERSDKVYFSYVMMIQWLYLYTFYRDLSDQILRDGAYTDKVKVYFSLY